MITPQQDPFYFCRMMCCMDGADSFLLALQTILELNWERMFKGGRMWRLGRTCSTTWRRGVLTVFQNISMVRVSCYRPWTRPRATLADCETELARRLEADRRQAIEERGARQACALVEEGGKPVSVF